jgi:hypothetical protein
MEKKEKCQNDFLKMIRTKSNFHELKEFYEKNLDDIDINYIDSDKRRPLMHAILAKNYDAVKFLFSCENIQKDIIDSVNSF